MPASLSSASARPRRVLIVDDYADAAESLALLLNLAGHDASTASDGQTALHAVSRNRPEVVLMDVDLPGMSGYELARKLRTEHAAAPMLLVALTGYCQDEDRQRAFRAGFHVHVAKPAQLDELERVLAVEPQHTSRHRSMDRTTFAAASA